MPFKAADIANQLHGEVLGNGDLLLSGFAPANAAKSTDLTFAENETFFAKADQSAAAAILIDRDYGPSNKTLIRVKSARVAFARVLPIFFPEQVFAPGIHPNAVVSPTAKIDPSAHIGPFCLIEDDVQIGPKVVLRGSNFIGRGTQIEAETQLFAHVTIYPNCQIGKNVRIHSGSVIGADGFGYVLDGGMHRKVPQIGKVILHDEVEIGANVTVDRGALGATIIGKGSKIDNLVQIAHNVVIGEHCLVVAQVGIAGSTKLGNFVTVAGQAGLAGHLKIANKATIAAQSGVMHDIAEGEKWFGTPAMPDRQMKRQILALQQLPMLLKRVAELEKQLKEGSRTPVEFPE